jgi:hypothetical protein
MVYAKSTVQLSETKKVLNVGSTYELTLKGATNGTWSTSNKKVASIKKISNTQYQVIAKKKGTSTVNVKVGTNTYSCKITVESPTINSTSSTLHIGRSMRLKVTGTTQKVTWSSSNKRVASVSNSGKVTANKKGTSTISAKVNGKTLKCKVSVVNHTYKTMAKSTSSSCTAKTTTTKTCSCGYTSTTTTSGTNHTYQTVTTEATCTQDGSEETKCTKCGYVQSKKYTSKFGHKYVLVNYIKPTDTERGMLEYQCTRCKDKYIRYTN